MREQHSACAAVDWFLYKKLFTTGMEGCICITTPSLDHAGNSTRTMDLPGAERHLSKRLSFSSASRNTLPSYLTSRDQQWQGRMRCKGCCGELS